MVVRADYGPTVLKRSFDHRRFHQLTRLLSIPRRRKSSSRLTQRTSRRLVRHPQPCYHSIRYMLMDGRVDLLSNASHRGWIILIFMEHREIASLIVQPLVQTSLFIQYCISAVRYATVNGASNAQDARIYKDNIRGVMCLMPI